jgi:hypothetical protein
MPVCRQHLRPLGRGLTSLTGLLLVYSLILSLFPVAQALAVAITLPYRPALDQPSVEAQVAPRAAQAVRSACSGSEGQWNCMTNSWQRCASGQWSVVMNCAAGTICQPAGLTYDFHVVATGASGNTGSSSSSISASKSRRTVLLWVIVATLLFVLGIV